MSVRRTSLTEAKFTKSQCLTRRSSPTMKAYPMLQTAGNICVALAAIIFLFPLPRVLGEYAGMYLSDDRWVMPILAYLIPVWMLLMGALLCMTANGGFETLRLSRSVLYTLTVAASVSLAVVTFVFIGLYIRPGFTPRVIYTPVIYLVPLATGLLVVLSINQKNPPAIPIQWLFWPWIAFAALSLVLCALFIGYRLINMAHRF